MTNSQRKLRFIKQFIEDCVVQATMAAVRQLLDGIREQQAELEAARMRYEAARLCAPQPRIIEGSCSVVRID